MGNCMDLFVSNSSSYSSPEEKKVRVLVFNGGEEEFTSSTSVEDITSGPYHGYKVVHNSQPHLPLSDDTKLIPGEVYLLLPELICNITNIPPMPQKIDDKGNGCGDKRSIRIILTKKQLEELLQFSNGGNELHGNENFSGPIGKNCQFMNEMDILRWKPALATIPESSVC